VQLGIVVIGCVGLNGLMSKSTIIIALYSDIWDSISMTCSSSYLWLDVWNGKDVCVSGEGKDFDLLSIFSKQLYQSNCNYL
jgi:hypothetical protein